MIPSLAFLACMNHQNRHPLRLYCWIIMLKFCAAGEVCNSVTLGRTSSIMPRCIPVLSPCSTNLSFRISSLCSSCCNVLIILWGTVMCGSASSPILAWTLNCSSITLNSCFLWVSGKPSFISLYLCFLFLQLMNCAH